MRHASVRTSDDLANAVIRALRKTSTGTAPKIASAAAVTDGGALVILRELVSEGQVRVIGTVGPGPYGVEYAEVTS